MKKTPLILYLIFLLLGCDKDETIVEMTPTITTTEITNITGIKATSGGNITEEGGAKVTARGICWSISTNPTTSDYFTNNGTGTGSFVSLLIELTENTTYYLRSYATNRIGTEYGDELSFTTSKGIPTLTTLPITEITPNTATSGGNISDDRGNNITTRGVCWSASTSPTTSDYFTNNETGAGDFVSLLTDLKEKTTYYLRSYATYDAGIVYGNELSFTTKDFVENIYIGDVLLTNQEEVDIFGVNNYTEIRGSLRIINNHSGSNITDLSSLISINLIDGNLEIEKNYLRSLNGLNRLTSISGNFRINNNFYLQGINEFNNLTHIGGFLSIKECYELTDINSLNNIPSVRGLSISHNNILRSINGLNLLSSISNGGELSINSNPELTHIDGLKSLISVNGQITITGNSKLSNLNGLSGLTSIGHYLYIENNNALINIDGLNNLNSLKGNLTIRYNPILINLCGIQSLVQNWYPSQGYPNYYSYYVNNNGYNPLIQDLLNGDCSL